MPRFAGSEMSQAVEATRSYALTSTVKTNDSDGGGCEDDETTICTRIKGNTVPDFENASVSGRPKWTEKRVLELLEDIRSTHENLLIGIGLNNRSKQDLTVIICQAANETDFKRNQQEDGSFTGMEGPKAFDKFGNENPNEQDLGLFQIQPHTANTLGLGNYRREAIRDDDELNTRLATTYLQQMIDKYDDLRTGLAAYKAGPTITDRRIKNGQTALSPKGQTYADNILECARRYKALGFPR